MNKSLVSTIATTACAMLLAMLTYFAKHIYEDVSVMRTGQAVFQAQFSTDVAAIRNIVSDHEQRIRNIESKK